MYLPKNLLSKCVNVIGIRSAYEGYVVFICDPVSFGIEEPGLVYFETSEPTHETTFHQIPEHCNLHIYWIILPACCVLPALCTVLACSWSETSDGLALSAKLRDPRAVQTPFPSVRTAAHFKKPSRRSVLQQWTVHSDRSGQINKQMPFHLSQAANLDWKSAMEQGLHGLKEAYDEGGPNIHPDGNVKFWHIMLMNL